MSGISVRELISTLNNFFLTSAGGELMVKHSPKILASEEKATTTIIPKEDEVHNKKNLFPRAGKLILPHPSLATALLECTWNFKLSVQLTYNKLVLCVRLLVTMHPTT